MAKSDIAGLLGIAAGKLLIGGDWVAPRRGGYFETVDPGTGRAVGTIAAGEQTDVDDAVAAAREAFDDERWRGRPGSQRAKVLWRIADLIEQHHDELTLLECVDQGQPTAYLGGMVTGAANCFRYHAGLADHIYGVATDVVAGGEPVHAYTRREPVGVAGMIVPWNAPLLMAAWKLAPMLAAGCSGVLKPAEETSLTALRLGRLVTEAGVPAGVVNVVTGHGHVAGAALAAHPDVDKIAFTGSTEVGKRLVHAAEGNLKRLTLELGGKSPFIVLDDADLDTTISAAAAAIFGNSGQVCSAGSRLLVDERVADRVVEGVSAIARRTRPGYHTDPAADIGPLISAKQLDRVIGYVDAARAAGAEVTAGGGRLGDDGYFVEPTVLTAISPDSPPAREEIFGPVVSVLPFGDVDEAVALANDTDYGLSSSIWTGDAARGHGVARRLRAGRVGINVHSAGDYHLPTGGFKQSGWGREHGPNGLDPYLEEKSVFTKIR
ncbi:aldehyde dehydrogenase family protein [Rhodococcus wratislaviensis]|uniref:Putative aldehyde dehydrogenase n=1 Tax=Rhodococcus wratislaviensis NBRC 100605 TaxID=1219028 RepID=X0QB44_RHOWR|nr:aldehyde dehydrogenase family protein [Rhodococcus wratislaviensis]GAF48136.1 putative aldehyde dehydrogenase [Rhodococcus wratislaviensis NBRC 100605]